MRGFVCLTVHCWPFIRGRDSELTGCCRPLADSDQLPGKRSSYIIYGRIYLVYSSPVRGSRNSDNGVTNWRLICSILTTVVMRLIPSKN